VEDALVEFHDGPPQRLLGVNKLLDKVRQR
jgi:hypothetical protein